MDRRHRNRLLIWLIFLGLANYVSYTVVYWYLEGDARNGVYQDGKYYLAGHFIRAREGRLSEPVTRAVWIYSFVHSISLWPTSAMMLVSMFILSRPHIIATMKSDSLMRGHTFVIVCITIVVFITGATTLYFILGFIGALRAIAAGGGYGV